MVYDYLDCFLHVLRARAVSGRYFALGERFHVEMEGQFYLLGGKVVAVRRWEGRRGRLRSRSPYHSLSL